MPGGGGGGLPELRGAVPGAVQQAAHPAHPQREERLPAPQPQDTR